MAKQEFRKCRLTGKLLPKEQMYNPVKGMYFESEEAYRLYSEARAEKLGIPYGGRCKCKATKEWGSIEEYYTSDGEDWFKNKEVYDEWKKQRDALSEVIDFIALDFLGYEPEQPLAPSAFKEIHRLTKFYDNTTLLQTIKDSYKDILYAIKNKEFIDERNEIRYIFAIISNRIKKTYDKEKRIQKVKAKASRELEIFEDTTVTTSSVVPKANDISAFLEEDDI